MRSASSTDELLSYVLERHRDEGGRPLAAQPIFWYRPLSATEQVKILAAKNIQYLRLQSAEEELRAVGHQLMLTHELFTLLHNLVRWDRVTHPHTQQEVRLPPPSKSGGAWNGATPERRKALDFLPRDWRIELVAAIIENRETNLLNPSETSDQR